MKIWTFGASRRPNTHSKMRWATKREHVVSGPSLSLLLADRLQSRRPSRGQHRHSIYAKSGGARQNSQIVDQALRYLSPPPPPPEGVKNIRPLSVITSTSLLHIWTTMPQPLLDMRKRRNLPLPPRKLGATLHLFCFSTQSCKRRSKYTLSCSPPKLVMQPKRD